MKEYLKKLLPDAFCVALFVVIAFAYFFAPVMDGKRILGHDNTANDGLQVELRQYRDSHDGETPRWINSIFGGMWDYLEYDDKGKPCTVLEMKTTKRSED